MAWIVAAMFLAYLAAPAYAICSGPIDGWRDVLGRVCVAITYTWIALFMLHGMGLIA